MLAGIIARPAAISWREFRRDLVGMGRDVRSETLPCVLFQELGVFRPSEKLVQLHTFAYGDKLHFGRDNALARVVKLGYIAAGFGSARAGDLVETQMGGFRIVRAFDAVFAGSLGRISVSPRSSSHAVRMCGKPCFRSMCAAGSPYTPLVS